MDRRDLRNALQDAGFTYRDARKIVSIIVEVMAKELKEKHELHLPFGTVSLRLPRPKRRISLGRIAIYGKKAKGEFTERT